MLESAKRVMLSERHDGNKARHHIQEERPEVADKSNNDQALRDTGCEVMAPGSEAVPHVVKQPFHDVIGQGCRTGKIEEDRYDRDDSRNGCQSPNGPVRRQLLTMQQSEMFRHL